MFTKKTINSVKDKLVKAYNPLKIYIFGSYAWGTPTQDSDLDLIIVIATSRQQFYERAVKGYHVLRDMTLSKDILVFTQKEFDEHAKDVTTLCYKTRQDGKILYDKS